MNVFDSPIVALPHIDSAGEFKNELHSEHES
jgi:hypothetical protein